MSSALRGEISPVEGGGRPLWSVMIPSYNCARYLRTTIESVLAQDPGERAMQIEVVDDRSTEDIEHLVSDVGGGRVAFHRQQANVGLPRNFETCIRRARGEFVHILHCDDAVRPGFYERLGAPLVARPEVGAAFCRYEAMDEEGMTVATAPLEQPRAGVLEGWLERIALGQRLQTPCMVVRRSVYETLGSFDTRLRYGEDWEMWVRIAAHFPVWYEPKVLARYRVHKHSSSAADLRTGANVAALRQVIALNREVLPTDSADRISRRALETTATTALRRAARAIGCGDTTTARAQARAAFQTSRRPTVWAHALTCGVKGLARWFIHVLGRHDERRRQTK